LKEIAIEFLNIIEDNGYKAYIVGGYVRDYLLKKESKDIDITTNATPKQIKKIFSNIIVKKSTLQNNDYGSVTINYKNILFEVTTFRKDLNYIDNRHPASIKYVDDLETDLRRRDFTINAICMDKNGQIIDLLNGVPDLKNKSIKTILDSKKSFKDDALRILRAIRFSCTLNFKLNDEIIEAIEINKKYLKNISYERKKIELDKIFASSHAREGIQLIQKLNLEKSLDLKNLNLIKDYTDIIGIWSIINSSEYKFTKHEKELIKKVNIVLELNNLDKLVLYKYGLYVNLLAGSNKGISKKKITKIYNRLPIKSRSDINITSLEICAVLKREPNSFLNEIYTNLEREIINNSLKNDKMKIINYLKTYFN